VKMEGVWSHMGVMESVVARGGIMPEVIAFVSNKGQTNATGIVKEIIVAPIAIIQGAVISIVITVIIYRPVCADAPCQYEERGGAKNHFQVIVHDEHLRPAGPG
jgi:hypothetical protein